MGTIPSSKDNFKYSYRLKQQLLHISKKYCKQLPDDLPMM